MNLSDEEYLQLFVNSNMSEFRKQAVNDLVKSAYKRYYRKLIMDGGELPVLLQKAVDEIGTEAFTTTVGRKKDTTQWFITISAKENVDYYKFYHQMAKCIKKKMLQGTGKYCIEQRSEGDQEPYGWHIHWLVQFESTSSKATIIQQVYQCFQSYVTASNYVDCKPVFSQQEWEAKEKYISGDKKAEKMAKVQKDRILREKYNLLNISY